MALNHIKHPLIEHKLGLMRESAVSTKELRELVAEVACLLAYEACRDLETETVVAQGWAGSVEVRRLEGLDITVVPILRAGLGMLDGVLWILPGARVSVVGMRRDEQTLEPTCYYERLADRLEQRQALVLDPMLATGGTVEATIDRLKAAGCARIKALFLVAAPEGIQRIQRAHPDVDLYVAAVDSALNAAGYIVPGLGDAGDRLFGTPP